MRLFAALFFALIALPAHAAWQDEPGAKLRWLDKVTARTGVVELRNEESAKYGDLVIRVKACRAQDPLEGADSTAFLQIWEARKKEDPEWVYSGWMFANSPGIAAMDHPVYDVWVLGCLGRPNAPAQSTEAQPGTLPTPEEADAAEAEEEEQTSTADIPDEAPVEDGDAAPVDDQEAAQETIIEDENAAQELPAQNEAVIPEEETVHDADAPYQPPVNAPPAAGSEPNWDAPFDGYNRTP